jgi:hypothetical protein
MCSAFIIQSLKSAFVFSHPNGDSSILATFSESLPFNIRFLSEHNSYVVERLNRRVCDDRPESTNFSNIVRPYSIISVWLLSKIAVFANSPPGFVQGRLSTQPD